ncbi:MAG: ATP-grasp domain-containing protein [Planctomycetota bacterium]
MWPDVVTFGTLQQARSLRTRMFVKPCDDKCFPSSVYDPGQLAGMTGSLPDDIPVLVSEPVEWSREVRAFVLHGKVATASQYAAGGGLAIDGAPEDAMRFLHRFLTSGSTTPPALALDVGHIVGRGWAVVEANPAWGAGTYGCDPARVLPVLERSCLRPRDVSTGDTPWVTHRQAPRP